MNMWRVREAMDGLVALEATLNDQLPTGALPLRVYRWRPRGLIEPPAIYHWAPDDTETEARDQARRRDALQLMCIVCVEHSDSNEEMAALEDYADLLRAAFDDAFDQTAPLGGVRNAKRLGFRPIEDQFGDIAVLGFGFDIEIWLDRVATRP